MPPFRRIGRSGPNQQGNWAAVSSALSSLARDYLPRTLVMLLILFTSSMPRSMAVALYLCLADNLARLPFLKFGQWHL